MKRISRFVCLGVIAVLSSCGSDNIRLNKDSSPLPCFDDLCSSVEVMSLDYSKPVTCSKLVKHKDQYVILDKVQGAVLLFDASGAFCTKLDTEGKEAVAFDIFGDRCLDVLVQDGVLEYELPSGKLTGHYAISPSVTLTDLVRRTENVINLSGYSSDGYDYQCEYYLDSDRYFECRGPLFSLFDKPAGHYFRSGETVYFCYSNTGNIWLCADFFSFSKDWNFAGVDESFEVLWMQLPGHTVWMQYSLHGEIKTLIYNLEDNRYLNFSRTEDGVEFPVGYIQGNNNYCFCNSSEVGRFLPEGKIGHYDSDFLVINYTLKQF